MPQLFEKIIILGNSGFIGTHLEAALRKSNPRVDIRGFSSSELNLLSQHEALRLQPLVDERTAIIMCSMLKKEAGDSLEIYSKNVEMVVNLCHAVENKSISRLVYLSSTAVYGEEVNNLNITEKTLLQPTSYYGMAKCACENLFRKVVGSQQKDALLILRPPLVYGPNDRSNAYGPAGFTKKAVANENIVLWGDGTELREFLFIDDLVNIMVRSLASEFSGIVNVVASARHTFKDILNILSQKLERTLLIESRARSKTKVDNCFDNSLLRELLPDVRFTPLEHGIQRIIDCELNLVK